MKYENVHLNDALRLVAMVPSDAFAMTQGRVSGKLIVADRTAPFEGTYAEVNEGLRNFFATVPGKFTGDIVFAVDGEDEFGNNVDLTGTADAAEVTANVEEIVGEDTDGNQVMDFKVHDKKVFCPIQISDVFVTVEVTDEGMVEAIRRECARRIEATVPSWQQQNAAQDMIAYLERGMDTLSDTEKEHVELIRAGNAFIKSMRAKSNELTAKGADVPFDIWDNVHWD